MLVGHSISDADGNILSMDLALCDLLHRHPRDVEGMNYAQLTHVDDVARNVSTVVGLAIGEGPVEVRKRYVRADRSTVWCDVHVSRFVIADRERLVGTIHLVNPGAVHRGPESLWRAARRISDLMLQRRIEFGSELFADQAWAILIDAYLAEAEGRLVSVAAISVSLETTTAITDRWVSALQNRGLIERPAWNNGTIQLTTAGLARIERLLGSQVDTPLGVS